MKTLLINPFITVSEDDPAQPSPMLSLPYLASYLIQNNFNAGILDISGSGSDNVTMVNGKKRFGLRKDEIIERIAVFNPDLVGISAPSTTHSDDVHELAAIVKSVDHDIKVVVGGAHASSNPERVLSDKNIDLVVIGEGEETLLEIVRRMKDKEQIDDVKGTALMKNGKFVKNTPRPYIDDLDSIGFPARHLLPMDNYFRVYQKGVNYTMRPRFTTMISSRGCPGNCIYCAVKTVWGRRWRYRSAKNVVDEIEHLIKEYNIGEVHFLDDSISVSKKRLIEICDEILKRKLDIKWTTPNGIAVWFMDKALLRKMKAAGCYRLTFGLESGNKETLNFAGKNYDYEHAKEMIKYAHKIGLWTIGTFIIGFPYEKKESIEDTVKFAISTSLDFAVFYIANPFPGTKMYEYFQKEGLIPKEDSLIVRGVGTKYFKQKELELLQSQAFFRFLKTRALKPWRVLNKIRTFEDLRYTFKLFKGFASMMSKKNTIEKDGTAALWKKAPYKKGLKNAK